MQVTQKSEEITDGKVDKFLRYVLRMRRFRNYADCHIANMDETPVWLEMPGKSTLNYIGNSEISVSYIGQEKKKITVILDAYADGTKMTPLVHLAFDHCQKMNFRLVLSFTCVAQAKNHGQTRKLLNFG